MFEEHREQPPLRSRKDVTSLDRTRGISTFLFETPIGLYRNELPCPTNQQHGFLTVMPIALAPFSCALLAWVGALLARGASKKPYNREKGLADGFTGLFILHHEDEDCASEETRSLN